MDIVVEQAERMPVDGQGTAEQEKEMGGGADRGVKNCFGCDSCQKEEVGRKQRQKAVDI